MINLIPPKGKRRVLRTYWLRVATVWCLLGAGALFASWTLLVPTHVLLSQQISALDTEEALLRREQRESGHIEEEIRYTNQLSSLLLREEATPDLSEIFDIIEGAAPQGVMLRAYTFERSGTVVKEAQIQGIAASRSALVSFRESLEQSALIDKADVPISDLVNDRDLPFVMTISVDKDAYDES